MEEFQKDRSNLIETNRRLGGQIRQHETSIVHLQSNNLWIMFTKMAITEADLEGSHVREATKDQRLLGLLHDVSSRVAATEFYAYSMNEMMYGEEGLCAGPGFPDLPALTHGYWGFVVPAQMAPNDTAPNLGVVLEVTDGLQPYNPQLVQDDVPLNTAVAFAPAVHARQVQTAQEDDVPVQAGGAEDDEMRDA
eukprot:5076710-Amphidinium_carterae.4